MAVRVSQWVWDYSMAEGNDRLVLLKIADNCNDEGMNAFPSVRHISAKCKLSTRTVQRSIKSLEEIGELYIEKRGGTSNTYIVVMGRPLSELGKVYTKVESQARRETEKMRASEDADVESVEPETTPSMDIVVAEAEKPVRQRAQDPIWEVTMSACGIDTGGINDAARGRYNKAVKLLKDSNATADEIIIRAMRYRKKFKGAALTPTALASHWAELSDLSEATTMAGVIPDGWSAIQLARQQREAING